jgi:N-acetylneuraminic acid mutarotase
VLALTPGSGAAWTQVAPLPTPRIWLGAAPGADGRVYVVGGALCADEDNILDVLEMYDPATNKWTNGTPMPSPRFELAVARGGDGRIYAIGGRGEEGSLLDVVEAYSPATDSWTTVAPLPSRRTQLMAATSTDGLIYVIGGLEATSDGTDSFFSKRVDVYSPKLNKWWTVPPTQELHFQGAAATGRQRVFAIGGLHGGVLEAAGVESRRSFCSVCQ